MEWRLGVGWVAEMELSTTEHWRREKERERVRRRGATKIGWEKENVREGEAGREMQKNERGAKRENRAFSVFWLERNPRGKEEREGVRA